MATSMAMNHYQDTYDKELGGWGFEDYVDDDDDEANEENEREKAGRGVEYEFFSTSAMGNLKPATYGVSIPKITAVCNKFGFNLPFGSRTNLRKEQLEELEDFFRGEADEDVYE